MKKEGNRKVEMVIKKRSNVDIKLPISSDSNDPISPSIANRQFEKLMRASLISSLSKF